MPGDIESLRAPSETLRLKYTGAKAKTLLPEDSHYDVGISHAGTGTWTTPAGHREAMSQPIQLFEHDSGLCTPQLVC